MRRFNWNLHWLMRRLFFPILFSGCLPSALALQIGTNQLDVLKNEFITRYVILLHAEYEDSLTGALNLQASINQFVSLPSQETMRIAQTAWFDSRIPYLQTEVGRFYDGPIETIEGFMNAWPVDEDYL